MCCARFYIIDTDNKPYPRGHFWAPDFREEMALAGYYVISIQPDLFCSPVDDIGAGFFDVLFILDGICQSSFSR